MLVVHVNPRMRSAYKPSALTRHLLIQSRPSTYLPSSPPACLARKSEVFNGSERFWLVILKLVQVLHGCKVWASNSSCVAHQPVCFACLFGLCAEILACLPACLSACLFA